MTREWDAIIVGGGAAGLSAAQMLGRSRRRTLVVDAGQPRNRFADHMHGVLGMDGQKPADILARGRAEAQSYGVSFVPGTVAAVADHQDTLRVTLRDGAVEVTRSLVLATGLRDDTATIPGLDEHWGSRVLHCPYCHGWEVAGRRLGVLTTSPASLHQVELVRQLSDAVIAFTALAEPLDDEAKARLVAREVAIEPAPVIAVGSAADGLVLTTATGTTHTVDALFTAPAPVLDLSFADALNLARMDAPGSPVHADMRGATSHPRVFAAGNVVAPFANVPVSMGQGSMAGAGANAMLTSEDFSRAVASRTAARNAGWEQRYADEERFWSGRVNSSVAQVVASLTPGTALDIGSGEGGDVVWLAQQGWQATGVDVSPTAVRRAQELAAQHSVRAEFVASDGVQGVDGRFDLVLASFFHSWEPDFPRVRMLREAAERVAPGGHLLVVSHAAPPPWVRELPPHMPPMLRPEEELALLALHAPAWVPELVEVRTREVTAPDGTPALLEDGVLLLRRSAL